MKKEFHLTKSGIAELESELENLKAQRKPIAEKLKTAREHGDLSENAEYHSARDEQVHIETRIKEIEHILRNVEIIKEHKKSSTVSLGHTVVLKNGGADMTYTIVGSFEANPLEGKISDESPIGKALLGQKIGDKVTIKLPAGDKEYTIKSIS